MSSRIQNVSLSFRYLFQFLFIAMIIIHFSLWFLADNQVINLADDMITFSVLPENVQILYEMGIGTKLLGFLISAIPLLAQLFILYCLIQLFKLYEKGEIFLGKNVHYIKQAGYGIIIWQLLKPITEPLLTFATSWGNPVGQGLRIISVSFSGVEVGMLIVGCLIILISWIMGEGTKLREEQKLTV